METTISGLFCFVLPLTFRISPFVFSARFGFLGVAMMDLADGSPRIKLAKQSAAHQTFPRYMLH